MQTKTSKNEYFRALIFSFLMLNVSVILCLYIILSRMGDIPFMLIGLIMALVGLSSVRSVEMNWKDYKNSKSAT